MKKSKFAEEVSMTKRSLLYANQKGLKNALNNSNSPLSQRSCRTPTDFKSQTMRIFQKAEPKLSDLTTLKAENNNLTKENEKLKLKIASLNNSLNSIKLQNSELVKALVDVIQVFTEAGAKSSIFKNKLLLEIKTTLVSKFEELALHDLDYKQQIEQVSLWGTRVFEPYKSLPEAISTSQSAKALFNFEGELVIFN